MEEKERFEYIHNDEIGDGILDIKTNNEIYDIEQMSALLNQQNARIKELEKENQQLKDQARKAYQEGLLQKQFDKDMEIQELESKIEFLTTFKEVISEHKPAFCKLAGRDCEWLGKEKQLAISELEKVKEYIVLNDKYDEEVGCNIIETFGLLEGLADKIKSLKGEE